MPSAKIVKRMDIDVIFGIVNEENDKRANSIHRLLQIEDKKRKGEERMQ